MNNIRWNKSLQRWLALIWNDWLPSTHCQNRSDFPNIWIFESNIQTIDFVLYSSDECIGSEFVDENRSKRLFVSSVCLAKLFVKTTVLSDFQMFSNRKTYFSIIEWSVKYKLTLASALSLLSLLLNQIRDQYRELDSKTNEFSTDSNIHLLN